MSDQKTKEAARTLYDYYVDVLFKAARNWTFLDGMGCYEFLEPSGNRFKAIQVNRGFWGGAEVSFVQCEFTETYNTGWGRNETICTIKLTREEVRRLDALIDPRREAGIEKFNLERNRKKIEYVLDVFPDAKL